MRNIIRVFRNFLGLAFYVSPLDSFLETYDKDHPKLSLAQRIEKEKYARITHLRDHKVMPETKPSFWDQF